MTKTFIKITDISDFYQFKCNTSFILVSPNSAMLFEAGASIVPRNSLMSPLDNHYQWAELYLYVISDGVVENRPVSPNQAALNGEAKFVAIDTAFLAPLLNSDDESFAEILQSLNGTGNFQKIAELIAKHDADVKSRDELLSNELVTCRNHVQANGLKLAKLDEEFTDFIAISQKNAKSLRKFTYAQIILFICVCLYIVIMFMHTRNGGVRRIDDRSELFYC